jgi:hypothetical protein
MKVITLTALVAMIVAFPIFLKKAKIAVVDYKDRTKPIDDNHLYDIDDFLS